jgi:hypothetical protein
MKELGISKFASQDDIDILLNRINNTMKRIAKFNNIDNKEFKNKLLNNVKDEDSKYLIHGDYKYRNNNVEVFMHQRTMKKVKYKKREYDTIHPINTKTIENIRNKILEDLNEVYVNDRLIREMNKIKNII